GVVRRIQRGTGPASRGRWRQLARRRRKLAGQRQLARQRKLARRRQLAGRRLAWRALPRRSLSRQLFRFPRTVVLLGTVLAVLLLRLSQRLLLPRLLRARLRSAGRTCDAAAGRRARAGHDVSILLPERRLLPGGAVVPAGLAARVAAITRGTLAKRRAAATPGRMDSPSRTRGLARASAWPYDNGRRLP